MTEDIYQKIKGIYNQSASAYVEKRNDPARSGWNNFLEFPAMEGVLKDVVKGKRVLDLGCGSGIFTTKLKSWGAAVCGVDMSEEMLKLAQKKDPAIEYKCANINELPYENGNFEILASSLVMHYLPDLSLAFAEASRVLVENGIFVFSMHHPFGDYFNGELDSKHPYFHSELYRWQMCGAEMISFHHTFEDIVSNLQRAGFVVRQLIECRPPEHFKEQFGQFEFTSNYPSFCVIQAEKWREK